MKCVYRFEKETAEKGHNGTILAGPVVQGDMREPFSHAWGYLDGPGAMEAHSHDTYEVYLMVEGEGKVVLGDQEIPVKQGDVVNIMPGVCHAMINEKDAPLKWAALWWAGEGGTQPAGMDQT